MLYVSHAVPCLRRCRVSRKTLPAMGVTSALQDAAALTKCVDGIDTPLSAALKEYESARRVPAALLQLVSRVAMVFIENVLCR